MIKTQCQQSSTERWRADGVAMASALADDDSLWTELVDRGGGHLFKHTGDGICTVFDSAKAAVATALAAQGTDRWGADLSARPRGVPGVAHRP